MTFLLLDNLFWLSMVFLPLLVASAFLVPRWRLGLTLLSPWAALPALLMAVFIKPGSSVRIAWFFLEAQFGMDATAKVFLFFTALVWLIAGVYACYYFSDEDKKQRFFVYYLLAMCGNIGLIMAQDVISFYFLFALMSFASYGLVVHSKTKSAYTAGKVYICLVVIGEALVFSSLIMAAHASGSIYLLDLPGKVALSSMRDVIVGLALLGFGIKVGALPFHVWLPLAHPVAPTPASAILSASMIKAGLLGWLRILPLGEAVLSQWGILVITAGLLAAFYGVIIGLTQNHAKTVLAYSSISQMGMMTVIVGVGLLAPELWSYSWAVLMMYTIHHALAKGALFLSVGTATTKISVPFLRYLRIFGLLLPAFVIMGIPFTSGALAKMSLKYIIGEAFQSSVAIDLLKWLLGGAAIGTTLIISRFLWLVWPIKTNNDVSVKKGVYLAWSVILVFVISFPFLLQFQDFIKLPSKESSYFFKWNSLWPLIMGGLITWVVLRKQWRNSFHVSEGDLLTVYMKVLSFCKSIICALVQIMIARKQNLVISFSRSSNRVVPQLDRIDHFSRRLGTWRIFGVSFLILFLTFFLLLSIR